ncbi:4a-hydroxytetrahydrobiopterin dehydratase [Ottowia sp.]|uniref:4a-hydroxytetrahydrobiopterin dehydratase n=1 Tax=Ottowia sp. TaxID=1898956 RepID=UPI002C36EAEB|nr:4a-hydroxytetrahydrobiopterin dehydratase [Ottowia sp.]HRN76747.1 4a-hydroxytetrahydrobiopterin dehydratase [Ottowia sp.]HRQ03859.1 4a-hydroxytetrahydrobiopterin dehydratase [Ottowia sp.]
MTPPDASANPPVALTTAELQAALQALPGWTVVHSNAADAICKHWHFDDFRQAMVFANAIAELAEHLNHHPDLLIGWGRGDVRWSTHDAGGVSQRDLDAARQTDMQAARLGARDDADSGTA